VSFGACHREMFKRVKRVYVVLLQESVHFSQCILDRFTGSDPSLTDCILEPPAKWPTDDVIPWKKTLVEPAADTGCYNCLAWVDRGNNVLKKNPW
jgi:hypothetical protein